MAYSAALLLLLCFCSAFSGAKNFLSVPVSKQPLTGRFVAKIFHGIHPHQQSADLVLDLGGSVTIFDCRQSSTPRPVSCPSLQCSKAGDAAQIERLGDDHQLVEDAVAVGGSVDSVNSSVDSFLFHCSGIGSSRVLGLGRSRMTLPSQFSMTHFLDRKFALCLSASANGQLLIGDGLAGSDISKTLIYTPLLTPKDSHSAQHYIPVKSIKIGSVDPDPVKVNGRARLSTTAPFTTLKTSIYQSFVNKLVTAVITSSTNINSTVVTEWRQFKTCFMIRDSSVLFPEVDLVLQSEMVRWRIGKRNLMVVVDKQKGVSCLGILEGGSEMGDDEIVIGRYQLVDNLMEFDMGRSMLGFVSTSCRELKVLDSGSTGGYYSS